MLCVDCRYPIQADERSRWNDAESRYGADSGWGRFHRVDSVQGSHRGDRWLASESWVDVSFVRRVGRSSSPLRSAG